MKISLLIIALIIIFARLFSPGIHVAYDLHILPKDEIVRQFSYPYTWGSGGSVGLGEYNATFLWSYLPNLFSTLLAFLNIPDEVRLMIFPLLPTLIIGVYGIKKLLEYSGVIMGKYAAILLYLINTYIILLIDGGQLNLAVTYALLPLTFYFYRLTIEKFKKNNIFKFLLSLIGLSVFDIRIIYLLLLLISVDFLFEIFTNKHLLVFKLRKYFLLGLICIVSFFGFHAYWILPSILAKAPSLPLTYNRSTQVDFLSFASLGHSLYLVQPHWYKNVFGQISPLRWYFVFIPIMVFLAPVLRRKNRWVAFYLLIALISIFLAKGSSDPLPNLYGWFFKYIPAFSFFRDPTKFFFLSALSYSILFGISVEELGKKIILKKQFIFLMVVTFYLLWLVKPVYLGYMNGMFGKPSFQAEYSNLGHLLKSDKNFSRVLWIPVQAPLAYADISHPSVEASRLISSRPFAIGTKGSYETFNFLREASFMGEIFDVAGIGYISYPYLDPRRDNLHPDNIKYYYNFSDQLSKLSWLSRVDNSPIPLWQIKKHQDRFFITPNIWWVIGSDSIYSEATKSGQLKLSQNALIFAEEYSGFGHKIDQLPEAKIVLNNKTTLDLAASFIESTQLIFPARQLDFVPNASGWWKREAADLIRWRDFLQTKYNIDNQDFDLGGGWAVGEGEKKFQISNFKYQKDSVLLARVLESTRSGQLRFYQNDELIGKIDTKKEGNNVRWFGVGQLKKDRELTVASEGDINVVNALAILDKDKWLNYQDKARKLQGRVVNFNELNAKGDNQAMVIYQQINPTKYKVTVNNLTKPVLLIFSENYDNLWKLNDQSALPVYSLLNGFRIAKNGEYIIEFEAQKYVYPGLIISVITIGLIAYFLKI